MGVFREGGRQRELVLTSSRVEIRKGFWVGYQERIKGPEAVVVEAPAVGPLTVQWRGAWAGMSHLLGPETGGFLRLSWPFF